MKRNLKKAIIVAAIIFAALQLLSASSGEEEYRTYFVLENETVTPEWVRIDYSFLGEKSSVSATESSIEVAKFAYLSDAEISRLLSSSWILDKDGYSSSPLLNARTVVSLIEDYLNSRYPYTGPITAETAENFFEDKISLLITPYQAYSVTYFQVMTHITPEEVNYFSATYSTGMDLSWDHKFTKNFGVGASLGANLTFGEGERFVNLSPMFQMAATMFRLGTVEFTTRMGFGGFMTINEDSVSFVPGIRGALGLSITVSPNITFILESGLDVGLWLWRSMSSEGFMLAIQKPLSLGVGVRL